MNVEDRVSAETEGVPVRSVTLDSAGETRVVAHGRSAAAVFPTGRVTRSTLEPGWRWSLSVGTKLGVDLCTTPHLGYVVAGRMVVRMQDGTEYRYGAGDAYAVSSEPHDAWVEGDESYVAVDVRATNT
jgi:hypothetical protein